MSHLYVMTYRPNSAKVAFFGPFTAEDAATTWGRRWQAENRDSSCWQVMAGHPSIQFVKLSTVEA